MSQDCCYPTNLNLNAISQLALAYKKRVLSMGSVYICTCTLYMETHLTIWRHILQSKLSCTAPYNSPIIKVLLNNTMHSNACRSYLSRINLKSTIDRPGVRHASDTESLVSAVVVFIPSLLYLPVNSNMCATNMTGEVCLVPHNDSMALNILCEHDGLCSEREDS